MNNYDYPCGSDTPDAPWNQVAYEEEVFNVESSFTLTRNNDLSTKDYEIEVYDDEEGGVHRSITTPHTEWDKCFNDKYFNPIEIFEYLRPLVEYAIETSDNKDSKRIYKLLLESMTGWEITDECHERN